MLFLSAVNLRYSLSVVSRRPSMSSVRPGTVPPTYRALLPPSPARMGPPANTVSANTAIMRFFIDSSPSQRGGRLAGYGGGWLERGRVYHTAGCGAPELRLGLVA